MAIQKLRHVVSTKTVHEFYQTYTTSGLTEFGMLPKVRRGKFSHSVPPATTTQNELKLDDLSEIISRVKSIMSDLKAKPEDLQALLDSDFIIQECGRETRRHCHYNEDNSPQEEQGEIVEAIIYEKRSVLEQLVLTPNTLSDLLSNSNQNFTHEMRSTFKQHLRHLDLTPMETVDFRDLDLYGASFEGAKLGTSFFFDNDTPQGGRFATTTNVNFKGADLRLCTISQTQLDNSSTYEDAILPPGCSIYWNQPFKTNILIYLASLKEHLKENNIPKIDPKHIKITELYNVYSKKLGDQNIFSFEKKLMIGAFKESLNVFKEHRNYYFLGKELLAFFCLLVVPYILISFVNLCRNNHFGMFSQPATEKFVKSLLKDIEQFDPVNYSASAEPKLTA